MRGVVFAVVIGAAVVFAHGSWAADLTRAQVQNFLGALQELKAVAAQYAETSEGDTEEDRRFSRSVAMVQAAGGEDMDAIAQRHDFTDAAAWGLIGDRVMSAYVALAAEAERPKFDKQLAPAREMMEAHGTTATNAEHEVVMQRLRDTIMGMDDVASRASKADKDAVREFVPAIESVLADISD